ncbi:hypothetical protein MFRU_004g04040 [Monilinia fructicola]|nr:hypothetical protein MFRU_004g04040 [Monilinia fructicola]
MDMDNILYYATVVFCLISSVVLISFGNARWLIPQTEICMRARLLADLLDTDPEKRHEMILDLCFFVVKHKYYRERLDKKFLPEIHQHLERRIREPGMIRRASRRFQSLTCIERARYTVASGHTFWDRERNRIDAEELRHWNIPTLERPMGLENELAKVERWIEEFREEMAASREIDGQICEDKSGLKTEISELVDLELGL